MSSSPPKWPGRFLKLYCDPDIVEEVLGDLEELYFERILKDGKTLAKWAMVWDVVRFFRWSNIKIVSTFYTNISTTMWQNYLKIGLRNIARNWLASTISITGLVLAIGCAITTFIFADFMFHMDSFHANRENTYQIVRHMPEEDGEQIYGTSPLLLGAEIENSHPSVEAVTRMHHEYGYVRHGSNVFRDKVLFVDPSYFEMFSFPLERGDASRLKDKQAIFLNKNMAVKYFGDLDPIGKEMSIKFGDRVLLFDVAGIINQVPSNASFQPRIVVPLANYLVLNQEAKDWSHLVNATFVQLKDGSKPEELSSVLSNYSSLFDADNPKTPMSGYEMISLTNLSKRAEGIQDRVSFGNGRGGTIGIAIMGFLLLLFACFNYMNIAVASATKRLKEIGIRKVMGSNKSGIIQQFLVENFLLCFFALALGAVVAYFIIMPGFNYITPIEVPFQFSSPLTAILFFASVLFATGFLSGSYPAFYISRFQPISILKGTLSIKTKNYFSRSLLTFQFFLAFTTIIGSFIFTDNAQFVKEKSWGYDPTGILSVRVPNVVDLEKLKNKAGVLGGVSAVSSSKGQVGVVSPHFTFEEFDNKFKAITYDVRSGYLPLMDMTLVEGRFFDPSKEEAENTALVVNELFVQKMGWADGVGRTVQFEGVNRHVIGVVKDFYHAFFDQDDQRPMLFTNNSRPHDFLIIKTKGDLMEVDALMAEAWHGVLPNDPYNSYVQSDLFDRHYTNVDNNISLMLTVTIMTIVLSCLGLYGLLSFSLQKKVKEFSIRKVLGAEQFHIVKLANKEFLWVLIISFGIGAPCAIFLMDMVKVELFTIAKPFSIWPILAALGITFLTISLTVMGQVLKATRLNPAKILRSE